MAPVFDVESRRRYLQLDVVAEKDLPALWAMIQPALPGILDVFYNHMAVTPELAHMFAGRSIEALKKAQHDHWQGVFLHGFDAAYISRIERIGTAHVRIGLEPRWFIGAYNLIFNQLLRVVDARTKWHFHRRCVLQTLLSRVIFMDLDAIVSVYYEHENANRQHQQQQLATRMVEGFDREASVQIQTVAAATEELNSSVGGIVSRVQQASQLAAQAHVHGQAAHAANDHLRASATQIASVVELIRDVAEQTNLLALNAAIEAARAGDAGRGFAVVASEVKKLAQATTEATSDIGTKIADIQRATDGVVEVAIKTTSSLGSISQAMEEITFQVREQGVATRSISSSMLDVQDSLKRLMNEVIAG